MSPSPASEELALAALEWIAGTAIADGDGARWSGQPSSAEPDPTLYHGTAGIVLALVEADAHGGDPRWGELARHGTRWLAGAMDAFDTARYPSLYFGAAGIAFALHEAAGYLGGDGAEEARAAARRALASVRAAYDGDRWGDGYDLMSGNAGIGLAALRLGDAGLAAAAVAPYLRMAEATPFGLTWEQRRGQPARRHHISHGTLGIAYALAAIGTAVGRRDLIDAALAAVADVVSRNEAGPGGFLVPHSDPQQVAFGLDRYSYGWCHGPAGDAQVFRLLAQLADGAFGADHAERASDAERASHPQGAYHAERASHPHDADHADGAGGGRDPSDTGRADDARGRDGVNDAGASRFAGRSARDTAADWPALATRCWQTVTTCGLPERLRPGFWDNSGRCCGTGGVLALACDREVEDGDGLGFADLLVADLAARATVDAAGARWSNVEYRAARPELEPRPGWAMGNAGLVRELLRHARITTGRDPSYAVQWPDHPATAPPPTAPPPTGRGTHDR